MNTSVKLDIVNLIENNPITKFDKIYQNKFIQKIQQKFTDTEQQIFIGSFYCYINYGKNDFVIDLENIWKWLGFSRKDPAKVVVEKNFVKNIDYKTILQQPLEKSKGRPKETILLNVNTFKKLCLKSNTQKADEIHDYFIKLEETVQEIINEEANELKMQLQLKDEQLECKNEQLQIKDEQLECKDEELQIKKQQLENQRLLSEKEKEALREKTIIEHFPHNIQCVYYGEIDNQTGNNESLIKFGNSNHLKDRVDIHRKTFNNFRLVNAFKVNNKFQIENEIKKHPTLKTLRRTITINGQNQTELLVRHISFDELDKIIKEIITNIEYTPENFKKLLDENNKLKKENKIFKELVRRHRIKPIKKTSEESKEQTLTNEIIETPLLQEQQQIVLSDDEYNYTTNHLRRFAREKDGLFHVGENTYPKLTGTRAEVWNDIAYKTTGGLIKQELTIGRDGIIVSLQKRTTSMEKNNLGEHGKPRNKPTP